MNKLFGIGLSRTGTKSLAEALKLLGFQFFHCPTKERLANLTNVLGASDIPVVRFYKQLDQQFPGSKFVYTVRDEASWLNSVERHFERKPAHKLSPWAYETRLAVYGRLDFDRNAFAELYRRHDKGVCKYFEGREEYQLLVLDICAGEGWEKLLPFMNQTHRKVPAFPHTNKTRT